LKDSPNKELIGREMVEAGRLFRRQVKIIQANDNEELIW